jgi:hypothetical protein
MMCGASFIIILFLFFSLVFLAISPGHTVAFFLYLQVGVSLLLLCNYHLAVGSFAAAAAVVAQEDRKSI